MSIAKSRFNPHNRTARRRDSGITRDVASTLRGTPLQEMGGLTEEDEDAVPSLPAKGVAARKAGRAAREHPHNLTARLPPSAHFQNVEELRDEDC